jgi:hypothetical protein
LRGRDCHSADRQQHGCSESGTYDGVRLHEYLLMT